MSIPFLIFFKKTQNGTNNYVVGIEKISEKVYNKTHMIYGFNSEGDLMKKNFVLAIIFVILCFLGLAAALVLEVYELDTYCTYAGMAASACGFISVIFGLNSWKEK